jgi:uncharacterized protein YndB with AHSA1/START domain
MSQKQKTRTITQKVTIPATPVQVYKAYTDAKEHAAFTGSPATSDPRVGGKVTAWDDYIQATYTELKPSERIVQQWKSGDFPEGSDPSTLTITLKATPHGTELIMVHEGVPESIADDIAQGWKDYYWKPLAEHFKKPRPKKT